MKKTLLATLIAGFSLSATTFAASYNGVDARQIAMGGTGVATVYGASAATYNSAMLSLQADEEDFTFLPSVMLALADEQKLRDNIDIYQDDNLEENFSAHIAEFNTALKAYKTDPGNPAVQQTLRDASRTLATDARTVSGLMTDISDAVLEGDGGVGMGIARPGRTIGLALYLNSDISMGVVGDIADSDIATLDDYASRLDQFADSIDTADLGARYDGSGLIDPYAGDSIDANARAIAVAVSEIGVALSHEFSVRDYRFSLGVVPKLQRIDTYDYRESLNDFSDSDVSDDGNSTDKTAFNMDLGYASALNESGTLVVGLNVKNLVPVEIETAHGHTVQLKPQVSTGLGFNTDMLSVAVDLDLTENKALGLGSNTQYLAAGVEVDLLDSLQLRAGYRHNLAAEGDVEPGVASIGVGLSPFGMSVNATVFGNADSVGGVLQAGIRF